MAYSRQQVDSFVPAGAEVLHQELLPETIPELTAPPLQTFVQIKPILLGGRSAALPEMWQGTNNRYARRPNVYQLRPTDDSQFRAQLTIVNEEDALLWLSFRQRRGTVRPVAYELTERPEEQVRIFSLGRPPREKRLSVRGF